MTGTAEPKAVLHQYLQRGREALLWKLDGLSEYDARRPMTVTGSNVLGIIKHVALVEGGYFGVVFGRPLPEVDEVMGPDLEDNADMWAAPDESRASIAALYRRVWAHSDATIEVLALDAEGRVSWWAAERQRVTLHTILVHMIAETHRHAGHVDILRETIDESVGVSPQNSNLPDGDADWWREYVERLEQVAREAGER